LPREIPAKAGPFHWGRLCGEYIFIPIPFSSQVGTRLEANKQIVDREPVGELLKLRSLAVAFSHSISEDIKWNHTVFLRRN
jgi:hypothetical protein